VDFIQNQPTPAVLVEKRFGIFNLPPGTREFAVKILDVIERLAEQCFAGPSHSR